jgi:hypothetical protein
MLSYCGWCSCKVCGKRTLVFSPVSASFEAKNICIDCGRYADILLKFAVLASIASSETKG